MSGMTASMYAAQRNENRPGICFVTDLICIGFPPRQAGNAPERGRGRGRGNEIERGGVYIKVSKLSLYIVIILILRDIGTSYLSCLPHVH